MSRTGGPVIGAGRPRPVVLNNRAMHNLNARPENTRARADTSEVRDLIYKDRKRHGYLVLICAGIWDKRREPETRGDGGAAYSSLYGWKCDVPGRLDRLTNAYCLRFTIDI